MKAKNMHSSVEIYLLASLFFFLPIGETVKSLFLGLFFLYWIYLALIKKTIVFTWDKWNILILIWICLVILSAALSGIKGNEWRSSVDLLRTLIFLYMVKNIHFEDQDINKLVFATITGTVAACLFMFWYQVESDWYRGLSLISIGSENTSAVYLSMISIFIIAYLVAYYEALSYVQKKLIIFSVMITVTALIMTGSRAGFGAFIFALLAIITIEYSKNTKLYLLFITIPVILVLIAFLFRLEVVYEFYEEFTSGNFLKIRLELWKYALIAGMKYPWFGLGAGNYDAVTAEQILQWAKDLNLEVAFGITEKQYWHSHAHNIFLQAFVDRGIVGVVLLMSILLAWLIEIIKGYRHYTFSRRPDLFFIWFSNLGALITVVLTGFVVTGFHHENGLFAMFLLGLLVSATQRKYGESDKSYKS